jgi:hypothetical protein
MRYVAAIATYLPCWGSAGRRVAGGDEDAVTLAVEAGRAAIRAAAGGGAADAGVADPGPDGQGSVRRVELVSRELPLALRPLTPWSSWSWMTSACGYSPG